MIAQNTTLTAGDSEISMHGGSSLMLSAKLYPTLIAATLEIVQNAVDSSPKNIWVKLDRKKRSLDVSDDGEGTSTGQFNEALLRRGQSSKGTDKLGRFGHGLVSPIDKCEVMTFTSCPKGQVDAYMQWTFRAAEIAPNPKPRIPHVPQPNIRFGKSNKTLTIDSKIVSQVTWRTKTSLRNYSTDREIGRIGSIDDLAKEIFSRYGSVMRTKKILLNIEFTSEAGKTESQNGLQAPEHTGVRLPEFIHNSDGIRTTFRLYLAKAEGRKGKSNGMVVVGESHNPFRFEFGLLVKNCGEYISEAVKNALKSGIFEGEIHSGAVTLHENRKQFNVNDGLVRFAQALEQWFLEVGAHHIESVEESQQGARYQKLGLESMQSIEAMLTTERFKHLAELLNLLKQGTIGKGHSDAEAIVGVQDVPSQRTKKETGTTATSTGGSTSKPQTDPPQTLKDHHPLTVTGPKGPRRHIVEGGSFGLQFSYENLSGEERLWIFEDTLGVLRFNIRHPVWAKCDTSDRRIKQLQELVAVQAVNWFFTEENLKPSLLTCINDMIEQQAFMLVHSPSFTSGAAKKIGE